MKKQLSYIAMSLFLALGMTSCLDKLDENAIDRNWSGDVDYTDSEGMKMQLLGAYGEFQSRGWEDILLLSVRGDDVNHGGEGDQQDFAEADKFNYNKDFWMINSIWQNFYKDVYAANSSIEEIEIYKQYVEDPALADQYIAEAKVLRSFLLFQITRTYGDVFIPVGSSQTELYDLTVQPKAVVLQHIVDEMDAAIPMLPTVHPNQRTDIRGGVTAYTAMAVKALANLERNDFQGVADATSEIIASGAFELEADFYELFKIKGKLNNENLLEMQYSDLGQGTGDQISYNFSCYGPQNWTPAVDKCSSGWGFYEPSFKWIDFMLKRGETVRLETSVLFTDRGIDQLKADYGYTSDDLPAFMTNVTRDGDQINDFARAYFSSGKHYLPTVQLTEGRTGYGNNKNYTCIRYAEILLMHAEALVQGASSSTMSADEAVNALRLRANLTQLSGVTLDDVMNEKFAELAMEWGTRYFDMLRLERYDELNYEGRTFTEDKAYLPYPQTQVDLIPSLQGLN